MSLNFGFGFEGKEDEFHRIFKECLTDVDKQFFHQDLPWLMMGTRVTWITDETIPHFVARIKLLPHAEATLRNLELVQVAAEHGAKAAAKLAAAYQKADQIIKDARPDGAAPSPEKTLRRFIGFHVNVPTSTSNDFLRGLQELRYEPFPILTQKAALKMNNNACKQHKAISDGTLPHPVHALKSV